SQNTTLAKSTTVTTSTAPITKRWPQQSANKLAALSVQTIQEQVASVLHSRASDPSNGLMPSRRIRPSTWEKWKEMATEKEKGLCAVNYWATDFRRLTQCMTSPRLSRRGSIPKTFAGNSSNLTAGDDGASPALA